MPDKNKCLPEDIDDDVAMTLSTEISG